METLEECVERALAELDPAARRRFPHDPLGVLTDDLGLTVQAAAHLSEAREDGGTCDGVSFLEDGVILYAQSGNRRENFTLAHELGHWLVNQVDDIIDWLGDQRDSAVAEETLCDRVASRLLVPEDVLDATVGSGPVRAEHVRELGERSLASLPVCAIALAGRVNTVGAVMVVERATMTVTYASVRPDPDKGWPVVHPWPGQELPASHPLRYLRTGATMTAKSHWATPWGKRESFYLDAYVDRHRIVAVLADEDLWHVERFHGAEEREFDERPQFEVRCCGQVHLVRGYPCQECKQARCPRCGKCRCDRRAAREVRCTGSCGLDYLPHLLDEDGKCDQCA